MKKLSKTALLGLPMNQLGLGGLVNNHFFKPKYMKQEEVITLSEFISCNSGLKINEDSFLCSKNEDLKERVPSLDYGFKKGSKSWKKIKTVLLENGFTHKEWILLLPDIKTAKGMFPNFALLKKDVLLDLPICKVTNIKESGEPYERLKDFFFKNEGTTRYISVSVRDIIMLDIKGAQSIYGVEKTLISIKKKLTEYGFTGKDGPFMKLNFSKLESESDYIEDLINNRDFKRKEAETAVRLGIKAGWIQI